MTSYTTGFNAGIEAALDVLFERKQKSTHQMIWPLLDSLIDRVRALKRPEPSEDDPMLLHNMLKEFQHDADLGELHLMRLLQVLIEALGERPRLRAALKAMEGE